MDDAGNFVVVWVGRDDLGDIYSQRYDKTGQRVGGKLRINSDTGESSYSPSVAKNANGEFIVVWVSINDGTVEEGSAEILGRRYDETGAPMGEEFRVSESLSFTLPQVPAVAMSKSGDFVVVWAILDRNAPDYDIYGRRFNEKGVPIGGEFLVNTQIWDHQLDPNVAIFDAGFVVVWESYYQDGSIYGRLYEERFPEDITPIGGEFRLTKSSERQEKPVVAMDDNGNFLAVWVSLNLKDRRSIKGQHFHKDGSPVGRDFHIAGDPTSDHVSVRKPAVAMGGDGNYVVVWGGWNSAAASKAPPIPRVAPVMTISFLLFILKFLQTNRKYHRRWWRCCR